MSRGFAMLEKGDDDRCLLVKRQCVNAWDKVLKFQKKMIAVTITYTG